MNRKLRIGTRDSQLAVWQATHVQQQLEKNGVATELVYIRSEGDIDLTTPLYEIGVQGIFTKALDIALLNNSIDIAVHSMKDVPVVLARGLAQAAVLERASHKDILVYKGAIASLDGPATIASSSIRRIAQWLHRHPHHLMVSLRGNVNTRLRKLEENNWQGAIFAAAGLERIDLRPPNSMELDWMLPAPAQGAIMVVCRANDEPAIKEVSTLDHKETAVTTAVERAFLKTLQGGCSTPVSALAEVQGDSLVFRGNIASTDGKFLHNVERTVPLADAPFIGPEAANEILDSAKPWIREALKKN